ncbi:MAG: hypothetical protein AAGI63_08490 [Planctomycetota bacterium]
MRSFIQSFALILVGFSMVVLTGCGESASESVAQTDSGDHDHDHGDHDHGHDHGDHDHGDHGDHDHGDHDHGDHDHGDEGDHDHPETLAEAINELVAAHETIAEGFAGEDPEVVHGPLHDIGHVLEDVEALVKKSELDDDTKNKLEEAVEQLFLAYGAVDGKLHDKPNGKDYSEVAEQIDAAISTLKEQVPVTEE